MARCSRKTCRRWRPDPIVRWAKLGIRVDGEWFCSDACVKSDATRRLLDVRAQDVVWRTPSMKIGAVLQHQGVVTSSQVGEALRAQRESGLRLGAQLQALGYASREVVLRALSAQNGVSYLTTVDPGNVRSAPGHLSADEVRALGIVPFRDASDRLLVACAAPLPHAALAALRALIGRTVEPYLVADDDFERLAAAYGAAADMSLETTTVRDITDGASRIAAVAAEAGAVSVTEARTDQYTWVRIAANGRISTVLVPPGSNQLEDEEWLAATTRH